MNKIIYKGKSYIELESIGHLYCPELKEIFPMNKDNTPDLENGLPRKEIDPSLGISTNDLQKCKKELKKN
tara:strand:- start:2200 stop:2409 length:210 start_codon:yes stop_codon:yes gene_type:complete